MSDTLAETRSIIVERTMRHPADKVWRALTQPALIEAWLMKNDFQAVVGHRFQFRAQPNAFWNGVTDCEVLVVESDRRLVFTWNASGEQAANGLRTTVTWTLTPSADGTHVRMEQSGFRPQDENGYQAMGGGWPRIVARLEDIASE
jgi:uncharacterized protein YndB with AHSA1/START domain